MSSDLCKSVGNSVLKKSLGHTAKQLDKNVVGGTIGGIAGGTIGGATGLVAGAAILAGGGVLATLFPPLAPVFAVHLVHAGGLAALTGIFGGVAAGAEKGANIANGIKH
jgi:hypothetical protein